MGPTASARRRYAFIIMWALCHMGSSGIKCGPNYLWSVTPPQLQRLSSGRLVHWRHRILYRTDLCHATVVTAVATILHFVNKCYTSEPENNSPPCSFYAHHFNSPSMKHYRSVVKLLKRRWWNATFRPFPSPPFLNALLPFPPPIPLEVGRPLSKVLGKRCNLPQRGNSIWCI